MNSRNEVIIVQGVVRDPGMEAVPQFAILDPDDRDRSPNDLPSFATYAEALAEATARGWVVITDTKPPAGPQG